MHDRQPASFATDNNNSPPDRLQNLLKAFLFLFLLFYTNLKLSLTGTQTSLHQIILLVLYT